MSQLQFDIMLLTSILVFLNPVCIVFATVPVFKISPSTYKTNEGEQVILSCTVDVSTLSDGQDVVWRRNSDIISVGEDVKEMYQNRFYLQLSTIDLGMYVLVIKKAIRSDSEYEYSCAVVNDNKVLAETNAVRIEIDSLPAPQYPDCGIGKDKYREGEILTITCTSERVTPPVQLLWYHDGNLLREQQDSPETNGDLVISRYSFKPTRNNNGDVYVCSQISSLKVTRNCTVGPLNILYEPLVTMQTSIEIEEGSEALLVCSASANPPPFLYSWSFSPTIDQRFYQLENMDQVLRIINVREYMNRTTVTCKVANKIGAVEADSLLIVKESFVFIDPPVVQTVGKAEPSNQISHSTTILSIAGGLLLFTALIVGVSLCYFHMCKRVTRIYESPYRIAQPEVYFEPKDNVPPLPMYPREGVYLKRHVAIQVSPDMDDESVYAEIEEVTYKKMMRYSSAVYSH